MFSFRLLFVFYSSFEPFIFNNLNISTIIIGANINIINSITFPVGNIGILNISLNAGINNITNINADEANIAQISLLLLNIFDAEDRTPSGSFRAEEF